MDHYSGCFRTRNLESSGVSSLPRSHDHAFGTHFELNAAGPIPALQKQGGYSGAVEMALGMAVVAIGLRGAAERLHWKSLDFPEGQPKRAAFEPGVDRLRVPSV